MSRETNGACDRCCFLSQGRNLMWEPNVLSMLRDLSQTPCAKWMIRTPRRSASRAQVSTSWCLVITGSWMPWAPVARVRAAGNRPHLVSQHTSLNKRCSSLLFKMRRNKWKNSPKTQNTIQTREFLSSCTKAHFLGLMIWDLFLCFLRCTHTLEIES